MAEWPPEGKPVNVEILCDSVVKAIRQLYTLKPRDYGARIKWKGPAIPRDMAATCLSFDESLTRRQLEYSEHDQGRDPLSVMIQIAVQLGIEQGKRLHNQEQAAALWMMRSGLKLLADNDGVTLPPGMED